MEDLATQPDFLEVYADREVTVFGITGRLQDLAGMCPVDLSDPRVSLEAKNEFVVKVANESGMEIAPEHETYFTKVLDQHGQERKFTVITSERDDTLEVHQGRQKSDTGSRTEDQKIQEHHVLQERPVIPRQIHRERHRTIDKIETPQVALAADSSQAGVIETRVEPVPAPVVAELIADAHQRNSTHDIDRPAETVTEQRKPAVQTVQKTKASMATHTTTVADKPRQTPGKSVVQEHVYEVGNNTGSLDTEDALSLKQEMQFEEHILLEMAVAQDNEQVDAAAEDPIDPALDVEWESLINEIIYGNDADELPISAAGLEQEAVVDELILPPAVVFDPPTVINNAKVLETVPDIDVEEGVSSEIFDDFRHALLAVMADTGFEPLEAVDDQVDIGKVPLENERYAVELDHTPELRPAIVLAVADHLGELTDEEKVSVAPLLREIMTTVQVVDAVSVEEVAPSLDEAIMSQLEEQVALLLDTLGIEYGDEDIEQLITLLLRPEFQLQQKSTEADIDLEREGTHEIKRTFAQFVSSSLNDIEYETEQLLGKFTVYYAANVHSKQLFSV